MPRCRYCGREGEWRDVLVGRTSNRVKPQRMMRMLVSPGPDPDGRVMVGRDGVLRLARLATLIPPEVVTYGVHSARGCAGIGGGPADVNVGEAAFVARLVRREVMRVLDEVDAR